MHGATIKKRKVNATEQELSADTGLTHFMIDESGAM